VAAAWETKAETAAEPVVLAVAAAAVTEHLATDQAAQPVQRTVAAAAEEHEAQQTRAGQESSS
jgi:hypothetical protein